MMVAILQARVSSSRLPAKVMKPILGKPMLQHELERIRRARRIEELVVATSYDPSDDPIAELCREMAVLCYRGELEDVLDRYYRAALMAGASHVVRLTGDCPLIDPQVVDMVVEFYLGGGYDYVSNCLEPTFPDGLDVEVFSFAALQKAWQEAALPSEREHVTPFIRKRTDLFSLGNLRCDQDLSFHRWTVDEPQDFEFVKAIYEGLYGEKGCFAMEDILAFLKENPRLLAINQGICRNEGYERSLQEDRRMTFRQRIGKSLALQERAARRIPGLSQLLSKRPDLYSWGVWPGYYSRAKGSRVWDLDGNVYVDMSIGGVGANVLGYADDDVDAAVKAAIDQGSSSSLNCAEEVELADLLCEIHPWAQGVRLTRAGGEAMAVAVRIARAFTGREKIAFCGYHGWHDWYLAANLAAKDALGEHLLAGLSPCGVPKGLAGTALPFRYNRLDELKDIVAGHRGQLAAIILEPIRNLQPEPGFLEAVRELACESGAVLIVDEISAGFRMNTGGAHLRLGLTPDLAVFSKALGNGYPIGAVIGKATVMDAAQLTFISSTCWTERIGPAAALATVRKFAALDAGSRLLEIGRLVQEGWQESARKNDLAVAVGGIPPLGHFTFLEGDHLLLKALFIQWMLERGFLATTGFYSMYAHSMKDVRDYLKAVDEVFGRIKEALREGNPERHLLGRPAVSSFKRLN